MSYYHCSICDRKLSSALCFRRHRDSAMHKKNAGENVDIFVYCIPCDKYFYSKGSHVRHNNTDSHLKNIGSDYTAKKYKCYVCNLDFSNYANLLRHTKESNIHKKKSGRDPFVFERCTACHKDLGTEQAYKRHINSVTHLNNIGAIVPYDRKEYCHVCNKYYVPEWFDKHLKTKLHKENLNWNSGEDCDFIDSSEESIGMELISI